MIYFEETDASELSGAREDLAVVLEAAAEIYSEAAEPSERDLLFEAILRMVLGAEDISAPWQPYVVRSLVRLAITILDDNEPLEGLETMARFLVYGGETPPYQYAIGGLAPELGHGLFAARMRQLLGSRNDHELRAKIRDVMEFGVRRVEDHGVNVGSLLRRAGHGIRATEAFRLNRSRSHAINELIRAAEAAWVGDRERAGHLTKLALRTLRGDIPSDSTVN